MTKSFEKRESYQQFKRDLRSKELVLFVGAGINAKLLPQWNTLLNDLLEYAVKYRLGGEWAGQETAGILAWLKGEDGHGTLSSYEKASFVKLLLGNHYLDVLHERLYRQFDHNVLDEERRKSVRFLHEIAKLCQHKNIHAVVTYNYDDLLEYCINRLAEREEGKEKTGYRRACSVYGMQQIAPDQGTLPIFHVHGFLPQHDRPLDPRMALVVLSYEEYYQTLLEPFSWQTVIQLHFLRSFTCLFLGISLRDTNMLRLLSHAQHYSQQKAQYILMCRQDLIGDSDLDWESNKIRIHATLFNDFGIRLLFSGNGHRTLVPVVQSIGDYLDSLGGRGDN